MFTLNFGLSVLPKYLSLSFGLIETKRNEPFQRSVNRSIEDFGRNHKLSSVGVWLSKSKYFLLKNQNKFLKSLFIFSTQVFDNLNLITFLPSSTQIFKYISNYIFEFQLKVLVQKNYIFNSLIIFRSKFSLIQKI